MSTSPDLSTEEEQDGDIHQIRAALAGLRFGSVQVIVQDGVIVQIDRTEKRRLRHQRPQRSPRFRKSELIALGRSDHLR